MLASIRLICVSVVCLVYLMGTSVFSHILIIQEHHPIEVTEHTHEDKTPHTHIETMPCSSVECYIDCANIEKTKVANISLWPHISCLEVSTHIPSVWYSDQYLWTILQLKRYNKLSISDHSRYRSKFLEFADLVGIILITS